MQYLHMLALLFVLVLSGCLFSGNPSIQDQTVVGQIKEGITPKDEVRTLLGKPDSVGHGSGTFPGRATYPVSAQTKYEIWTYQHLSGTGAATFIPIVGVIAGSAISHENSLTLFFDDKDLVKYVQSNDVESTP